jgi:class 3 adenylate cyclase
MRMWPVSAVCDIAKRVVGAAAVKLTRFERERALAKPTNSLAAYEYVLRGRDSFSHATRDVLHRKNVTDLGIVGFGPKVPPGCGLGQLDTDANMIPGTADAAFEQVARIDALNCAVEMQRASRAINDPIPPERRLELRIGVNLGDVIVDGDNIFGDGVNIAARLESLAQPGTVCISQTVYDQVRNKLDLDYRPLGSHRVKNIAEPVRAFAVGLPAAVPRPRRGWRPLAVAAGAAALVAVGLAAWVLSTSAGREIFGLGAATKPVDVASLAAPARLAGRPSIAVLPFKNLSSDPSQDYFSDGITEDVITALGRFSNLLVIAKSASFPFKDSKAAPAEIGRLLDNDKASELFQRAIDLDPNYAEAYAALGGSHYEAVVSGWSQFREDELERAKALAQKALALDPTTTRAYRLLSDIDLFSKRYDLALEQLDRALEINPSDADTMPTAAASWYGRVGPGRGSRGWKGRSALIAPTGGPRHGSAWRTTSSAGTARVSTRATEP